MTETTQLSGKIKHKCSKTMLLTPQELFELDRYIESLRASDSFTEDEKRAVTENDFSRWETLSCGLRTWIAEKHYAEFLAAPTVPVDEAYLESSVFELSLENGRSTRRSVLRSAHASSQTAAAVRIRSAFTSAASRR